MKQHPFTALILAAMLFCAQANAQTLPESNTALTAKEKNIITIAAYTAQGNLEALRTALANGLAQGLTINQIKEVLVHAYAYCGFPRSIRGLQTFMEVLDERKQNGIQDALGREASPVNSGDIKYERGRKILDTLVNAPQGRPVSGYGAFAPVIDTFLKEHLFASLFERDVLTYAERELTTLSVIGAIGKAEPMLRSHFTVAMKVGVTPQQLQEFVAVLYETLGKEGGDSAKEVLDSLLKNRPSR